MSGIKIANGTAASAEQTVDTDGNAHVVTPTDSDQAGFVALATENDAGLVTGSRRVRDLESTQDYRLRMGVDSILFHHSFEGTIIARDRIRQNDTTATAAQTNGRLTLNSGSSVTSGQGCNIRTYRNFPLFGSFSTYCEMWIFEANPLSTNSVSEWGFGYCSGVTAQLTDGLIFRRLAGGQLRAVVINNSVDVSTVDITTTNIPPRDESGVYEETEISHFIVEVNNDEARFWVNEVLVARIPTVSTSSSPSSSSSLPVMARVYNSGTASAARQIGLTYVSVQQGELNSGKPWSHQLAGSGMGSYQVQPGTTSAGTVSRASANFGWPASTTALSVGTWTATSAPAAATLGGRWISPAISTLTSEADYPVFSYLNPAGTAAIPGKTLYITGINIGQTVATAAASTNGILLCYAAGVGSTSPNTTATEGAAIVAARIVALDQVYFKLGAVVGDTQPGKNIDFSSGPLVVPAGCYFTFIVRPVGTVTSNTLVVQGMVQPVGYFE